MGAFRVLRIGKHDSYMRAHDGDDDRTMFLVNLPTDATDRHIRALFKNAGAIESVRLWKPASERLAKEDDRESGEPSSAALAAGKAAPPIVPLPPLDPRHPHALLPTATSAHVTFLDKSSLERALAMTQIKSWPDPFKGITSAQERLAHEDAERPGKHNKRKAMTADEAAASSVHKDGLAAPPIGLDFLLARHKTLRPPLPVVRKHVDSVIANFAWRKKHPEAAGGKKKAKGGIEAVSVGPEGEFLDADGFVIVGATGRFGRTTDSRGGGSVRIARAQQQLGGGGEDEGDASRPAKKKRLELDDFYRFQRREVKRQELADLRAKFQADQEKVKKLKAGRSFKPF